MRYLKTIFVTVFVLVSIVHLFLVIKWVTNNEEVVTKKETVQRIDLRNVSVPPKPKAKPKPKPKKKPKPKPKAKPLAKPKPIPVPEVIPKEEIKPESQQEKEEEAEEIEQEEVVQQPSLSAPEIEVLKSQYITEVKSAIEGKKYYPKKAKRLKHEGIVEVRFTILKDGSIKDVALANPSKYKRLNEGALQTLKSVGKFEPIPQELELEQWEIVVPIEYRLR